MKTVTAKSEGRRERKRQDTFRRIAETGLKLFLAKGYEETTLDDISAAADISRRAFFSYFKSKDEILLAWQSGLAESVRTSILAESTNQSPLDLLCAALLKQAEQFDAKTTIAIARLMRANVQLQAANQAKFLQLEQAAFEALCELWPQSVRRERLRLVAMAGLGAFRVAIDAWIDEGGEQPLTARIKGTFSNLRAELHR